MFFALVHSSLSVLPFHIIFQSLEKALQRVGEKLSDFRPAAEVCVPAWIAYSIFQWPSTHFATLSKDLVLPSPCALVPFLGLLCVALQSKIAASRKALTAAKAELSRVLAENSQLDAARGVAVARRDDILSKVCARARVLTAKGFAESQQT